MIKFLDAIQKEQPSVSFEAFRDGEGDVVLSVIINDYEIPILYLCHRTGCIRGYDLSVESLATLQEAGFEIKDNRLCVGAGFAQKEE